MSDGGDFPQSRIIRRADGSIDMDAYFPVARGARNAELRRSLGGAFQAPALEAVSRWSRMRSSARRMFSWLLA
jgi:hypothetical protein